MIYFIYKKELSGLVFLQDAASRSSQLTNGMVNILTSFEERLARLEKTILPVYNETKNLQQKQESKFLKFLQFLVY